MFSSLVKLLLIVCCFLSDILVLGQSFQDPANKLQNSDQKRLRYAHLSVSSIYITDGNNGILFDLSITKPSLSHWLLNRPFLPNEQVVREKLKLTNVNKVDAIFVSHTHFDHAIDIPLAAKIFKAKTYGGDSLFALLKAYEKKYSDTPLPFYKIKNDEEVIQVGSFKIRAMLRQHAAIFDWADFYFLEGNIDSTFDFKFYDYKVGENYAFAIEYENQKFIIDQGGRPFAKIINFFPQLDFAFIGIGNKKSKKDFIDFYLRKINTKKIILLHTDFFLLDSLETIFTELPGTSAREISQVMKEKYQVDVVIPQSYSTDFL